jgi:hypothetical protein
LLGKAKIYSKKFNCFAISILWFLFVRKF